MSSPPVRRLPTISRLQGIAPEENRWIFMFDSEGGLSIGIAFSYDDALLMLFYLDEARKGRGWPLPDHYEPKRFRMSRQPLTRATKMGGVYLDTANKYANVQFEADDEVIEILIPKDQVVRLLAIATALLRDRGWGTHAERCLFYAGTERCRAPKGPHAFFCETHAKEYANLTDREVLEQAVDYLGRSYKLKRPGQEQASSTDVHPLDQINARAIFATLVTELGGRGYTKEDAAKAVGAMAQKKGLLEPVAKDSRDPKWKQFEKLAFGISLLREDGAQVTFDEKIEGLNTERLRQFDICVRYDRNGRTYFVMVECKDKKVSIDQIEALHTKKADVGADQVVVVSSRGFQKGAHAAAKAYGIDIFHLKEKTADWTEEIRTHVNNLPWPQSIEFEMPQVALANGAKPMLVPLVETPFVNELDGMSTNLGLIVRDVCIWAHEAKLKLPCEVHVKFDDGMSFQPPKSFVFIPVYGLKMLLTRYKVETRQRLEFPPHTVEYRYTDEKTGNAESFAPGEVNRALQRRREDLT